MMSMALRLTRHKRLLPKLYQASFVPIPLDEVGIFWGNSFLIPSLKLIGKFCPHPKFAQRRRWRGKRILFFLPASLKKGEAGSERR